ncbi:hypothetical protein PUMCH_001609 [Australozyma saopauloensis]|uniref:A1 cistron-splicing factor AAR2 n=1 Tax=Australozyma saopauloensis TaxID=291208 RepID=A0AAX4H7V0_9ASCO|nr:hypothetical protein PUMCH_001609 [[Candida] saopauloensis]
MFLNQGLPQISVTMGPPNGTLIFHYPEDLGPDAVIGIDTQFLTAQGILKGIKLIPPGLHLFHFSRSISQGDCLRYGWWFFIEEGQVLSVDWSEEQSVFTIIPADNSVGELYPLMIEYPETHALWNELTKFVDTEALEEYIPTPPEPISTATPLLEENMVLAELLKKRQPTLKLESQEHKELKYTILQEKQQAPQKMGEELTRSALDRSWQFEQLFGHDKDLFLAELQLTLIHFVVLGNLCSCTQWSTLLYLILRCESFLRANPLFTSDLLSLMSTQLTLIPTEYIDELLVSQIVDVSKCRLAIEYLADFVPQLPSLYAPWQKLKFVAQRKLSMEKVGSIFDKNNFEIYDLGQHDADDEDAPAIVY